MDVCYGDKKGIPAGVYLFSRYKRAETDATFSPLAFTSFLFGFTIMAGTNPFLALSKVKCTVIHFLSFIVLEMEVFTFFEILKLLLETKE